MFNEDWYPTEQINHLVQAAQKTIPLQGEIYDVGIWEGKTTVALANAFYPQTITAVDHWKGNLAESNDHPTIQILNERDVFAVFKDNIDQQTKGNISIIKEDCLIFFKECAKKIKFIHIDIAHDYNSTKSIIEMVKNCIVPNGILCGDDFATANINRIDLNGGVERAVRELLPNFTTSDNFWCWQNS